MAKKWFDFLFEGFTSSGGHVGPTPIRKLAETAVEARRLAQKTFETSKSAKTSSWKNVTKKR